MNITFIGFGEAGGILSHDLQAQGHAVTVWDRKALDAESLPALRQKAQQSGVRLATSLAQALQDATLVFSTVTASQALTVAQQAAALLQPGQYFLDLNSVAPHTKRAAAETLSASAASYIDVAVMAPVPPKRLATPLLIGGDQAAAVHPLLLQLGLNSRLLGSDVGEASAIKMCRSIMIKGLEALTTECLSAARQYGVEQEVLDSLHASFPSLGWNDQLPHYLISRVAEHGQRRAEEMQEVVKTLQDVAVPAAMSAAIVATQQGLVDALDARSLRYHQLTPFVWQQTLDKIYSPQ
jgi:3-hydroxyisobutyrate dehydrogenase-like beta-hydroxyacid dehydrogenase